VRSAFRQRQCGTPN